MGLDGQEPPKNPQLFLRRVVLPKQKGFRRALATPHCNNLSFTLGDLDLENSVAAA